MTVDTDLATLREQLRHLGPWRGAVGDEALDRVETELARLRERERDLEDYYEKHQTELARLRAQMVALNLALDDAIKAAVNGEWTQEDYDMWDAARSLTQEQIDAYARALLADTADADPR